MSHSDITKRITGLVVAGFVCMMIVVAANDIFLPTLHLGFAFGTPEYDTASAAGMFDPQVAMPGLVEIGIEIVLVTCLALAVLAGIRSLLARIRYLEGFMLLCASCKQVRVGKNWIPLEEYLQQRADVKVSHSYCPECSVKMGAGHKH